MNRNLAPLFKVLSISLMLLAVAVFAADELETTKKAAEKGDAETMFKLGHWYINSDFGKAFRWWHEAAKQGHAGAQYHMGLVYNAGFDVELDIIRAYAWYSVAATQGNVDALAAKEQLEWVYMSRERIPEAVAAKAAADAAKDAAVAAAAAAAAAVATEEDADAAKHAAKDAVEAQLNQVSHEDQFLEPEEIAKAKALALRYQATYLPAQRN